MGLKPHHHLWFNKGVVFLGDSIHGTTPNLAQGGCQAIEDAYNLAMAISKYGLNEIAYMQYESLRRYKTDFIVKKSWQYGKFSHHNTTIRRHINQLFMKYLIPSFVLKNQYKRLIDLDYLFRI